MCYISDIVARGLSSKAEPTPIRTFGHAPAGAPAGYDPWRMRGRPAAFTGYSLPDYRAVSSKHKDAPADDPSGSGVDRGAKNASED